MNKKNPTQQTDSDFYLSEFNSRLNSPANKLTFRKVSRNETLVSNDNFPGEEVKTPSSLTQERQHEMLNEKLRESFRKNRTHFSLQYY